MDRLLRTFLVLSIGWSIASCSPAEPLQEAGKTLAAGEGYVDVEGGRVWYEIVGSGKATPVLLLHGGPGAPSYYLEPLRALADERPVIFYDQLGCGRSDQPSDDSLWTTERFVRELRQVRETLGLDQIHLYGHSWGTMLAAEYMRQGPGGVKSLVLASPALSVPRWLEDAGRLRAELPPETQEILSRHEAAGTTDSEEYLAATEQFYRRHLCRLDPWPETLTKTFSQLGRPYSVMWGPSEFHATGVLKDFDATGTLGQLKLPVLYTTGEYDEATPETVRWYQGLTPGASLEVFENASHLTMLEVPAEYVRVIREFLSRND